ncbi:patatin-like phospholipase family protein [Quisquiliibacterium transsilvanicum]|uniref:NTE family protein n=1 Tax=Quisquiliibacterium transsilvanicum TaxID=1549638 RepID=A0A7W8M955_9BURK|nr:patatin-like phospholipase family protein [Quisquiliibacterium transsilvanicum]MBB5271960.1 NTE family protein [Quisquiliibacterium transsilvanicum]
MPFGSEPRQPGVGLALSGGGFRAVLFHCGTLIRLNQLGILSKLARVSSVSGGSIVAGVLATRWPSLQIDPHDGFIGNLEDAVIEPLRAFTSETVDVGVVLGGAINPFRTAGEELIRCYRKRLALGVKLRELGDQGPRFVFNSTNYATGVTFRFSKPYCGDYRIGLMEEHDFDVAFAVGCSSAFPPVLAPIVVESDPSRFKKTKGANLWDDEDYRRRQHLADGGVYDNLGLETVWGRYETVLASDAGKPFDFDPAAGGYLADQLGRIRDIGLNQALALRKRMLIDAFQHQHGDAKGAYWGIDTEIANYGLADAIPVSARTSHEMAQIRTRLNRFSDAEQDRLINWGYAVCDAAIRKHVPQLVTRPGAPKQPRERHPVS